MMPIARFQLPDGRIARFEVPEGTTPEQAQSQMQAQMQSIQAQPTPPAEMPSPIQAGLQAGKEAAQRIFEPAAAVVSGAVAEPIAGIAGAVETIREGPEAGERAIEATREALTFQPRTEAGQEGLKAVGEAVAPVGEAISAAEKGIGDFAFDVTGSPTVAAAATALPAATLEAIGLGAGRRVAKGATRLQKAPGKIKSPTKVSERTVTKSLLEAAPEVDQIKDASRAIYKEIDDLNVNLKPGAADSLMRKVVGRAAKENVDDVLTPKSARVVKRLRESIGSPQARNMTQIDQLRQQAQIAAANITDPSDARLGAIMVDEIDDFLDKVPQGAFTGPDAATAAKVSERYKAARGLWGRARRAELISEAFDKANLQASGFENGIRTQLRSIVNNKKRSRFFTKDEVSAMRDVVKGASDANVLKLVGRLGFSEGAATNVLGGLGGIAVLGPAAPVVGQVSRKFAQTATRKAAERMESLIRGGAKGQEIAKAYLQSVPKAKRSVQDLTDLLLSSGQEVDDLLKSSNKFAKEAAEIARARKIFERAEAVGAAAPVVAQQPGDEE